MGVRRFVQVVREQRFCGKIGFEPEVVVFLVHISSTFDHLLVKPLARYVPLKLSFLKPPVTGDYSLASDGFISFVFTKVVTDHG